MSLRGWLAARANSAASGLMRRRDRLPGFVNAVMDDVARHPDGRWSRLASSLLGGGDAASIPPASTAPDAAIRVYIGPTNYAGQGYAWARALSAGPGVAARNMAVELPGGFRFPADRIVPVAVYNSSHAWQQAEFDAVAGFSHVLIEAERPLFGTLFDREVVREVAALAERGLSCAFICHGTDIRSPRIHLQLTPWSPYADDADEARELQTVADANLALLTAAGRPVFVSTPDLLLDVPFAEWCPVVVDPAVWLPGRALMSRARPVVAHVPSMGSTKGTHLIEPAMERLDRAGVIEYRRVTGVDAARMPRLVADADIVLDQFRIGSYGAAACEAMSAGRVVIGHVLAQVREAVERQSGFELPIHEATPDTLEEVVAALVADRDAVAAIGSRGRPFVEAVHSGPASAAILRSAWLERQTLGRHDA